MIQYAPPQSRSNIGCEDCSAGEAADVHGPSQTQSGKSVAIRGGEKWHKAEDGARDFKPCQGSLNAVSQPRYPMGPRIIIKDDNNLVGFAISDTTVLYMIL